MIVPPKLGLHVVGGKGKKNGVGEPEDALGTRDEHGRLRDADWKLVIKVKIPGIESMASVATDALAEAGGIYQRAGRLAHIVPATPQAEASSTWIDSEGRERKAVRAGTPQVRDLGRATLAARLDSCITWLKYIARTPASEDPWKPCQPHESVVSLVHEWGRWDGIPPLQGVASAPILRADGTLAQESGYDARSGWYLHFAEEFPEIPEQPTQKDAEEAYAELARIFVDFPFVEPAHRAVPIAAILTIVGRAGIRGSVPAFGFDASAGRIGKTKITDAISLIATGRFAARKAYPPDDEEMEKAFAGYAMAGAPLICIDDIKRPFGGEVLDMCITAMGDVDFRTLGKTEMRSYPWSTVLFATGNNLSYLGQMAARMLVARLESDRSRPQDRDDFTIPGELLDYVIEHRAKLVCAALTILRAWTWRRFPSTLGRWGGFDGFAQLIPPAIVYAGGPNVLDARPPDDGDANPDTELLVDVLRGLALLMIQSGGFPITTHDVHDAVFGRPDPARAVELKRMAEALRAMTRSKQLVDPTANAIGFALRRYKGKVCVVDGTDRRLVAGDRGRHGIPWSSVEVRR